MSEVPGWLWYVIVPLVIVQLTLQIWGILDLVKRDKGSFRGMKLIWFLVILLGESIGAILYFAVGRGMVGTPTVVEQGGAPTADRAKAAVDSLYGQGPSDADR